MRKTVGVFLLRGLIAPAVCLAGACPDAAGADDLAARVASYSISVTLNPEDHTLSASETLNWRNATELTANRVGLILCDDLETAARVIATEKASTTVPAKDRLRDLLAYSVSEPYFAVRRHLALNVRDEAAA